MVGKAKKKETAQVSIRLTQEMHEDLKKMAESEYRTVSQHVIHLVRKEIEVEKEKELLADKELFDFLSKQSLPSKKK